MLYDYIVANYDENVKVFFITPWFIQLPNQPVSANLDSDTM